MTQLLRVQAAWGYGSGLQRDVAVNTFHFEVPDSPDPDTLDIIDAEIVNFYDKTGDTDIKAHLSAYLTEGLQVKIYSGDTPGAPIATYEHAIGDPSSTQGLPLEVAACLSYRALPVPGVPAARLRGRVYIGPLNIDAITFGAGVPPTLSATFSTALQEAGSELAANANLAAVAAYWVIYSRADEQYRRIVSGWVDDEFDTQRRRGADAVSRYEWPEP